MNDLCTINNDGEFPFSNKYIYPKQLELKLEHQEKHATFLYLDITNVDNIFVFKLLDKRDTFPFFIVHMPYLLSNIPSWILYGSMFWEFLQTARLAGFVPKTCRLYTRMVTQSENKASIPCQIKMHSKDTLKHFLSILRHMTK